MWGTVREDRSFGGGRMAQALSLSATRPETGLRALDVVAHVLQKAGLVQLAMLGLRDQIADPLQGCSGETGHGCVKGVSGTLDVLDVLSPLFTRERRSFSLCTWSIILWALRFLLGCLEAAPVLLGSH